MRRGPLEVDTTTRSQVGERSPDAKEGAREKSGGPRPKKRKRGLRVIEKTERREAASAKMIQRPIQGQPDSNTQDEIRPVR